MRRLFSRMSIAAIVTAAMTMPLGVSSASHCTEPNIYVFTRFTVPGATNPTNGAQVGNPSAATTAAGCTVPAAGGHQDTNYIYPGANSFSLRYLGLNVAAPTSGTVTFAGTTWTFAASDFVANTSFFDTKLWTIFDQAKSVNGGTLTATICDSLRCVTRSFKTAQ